MEAYKKAFLKLPQSSKDQETTVSISPEMAELSVGQNAHRFPLQGLLKLLDTPDGLYLFFDAANVVILPTRVFNSQEERQSLLSHLLAHSKAEKTDLRT